MESRAIAAASKTTVLIAVALTVWFSSAQARGGGHGFHGGSFGHGAHFAGDRHHGDDAYIKAASDERDKLLNSKLKSICRGC
jgi:hypothetical protein